MAVAFVQEFPFVTHSTTNYDALVASLGGDANPPAGLIVHTAGFDDAAGVFRIFSVWDDPAAAQSYLEGTVLPAVEELLDGQPPSDYPSRQGFYALHHLVTA